MGQVRDSENEETIAQVSPRPGENSAEEGAATQPEGNLSEESKPATDVLPEDDDANVI
jgi:hypothetical protein